MIVLLTTIGIFLALSMLAFGVAVAANWRGYADAMRDHRWTGGRFSSLFFRAEGVFTAALVTSVGAGLWRNATSNGGAGEMLGNVAGWVALISLVALLGLAARDVFAGPHRTA